MKAYLYPFPRGTRVSQVFGANATKYNLSGKHTGEDAAVPTGTPIHAAGDGVIEAAGYFPTYNNEWLYGPMGGLTLVLDCGDSEPTFGYAHCSKTFVKAGDPVVKGQIIGESGETGAATGPHTHIEALPPSWNTYNGTYGRVDPRIYMTEFPGEINSQGNTILEDELSAKEVQEIKEFVFETLGVMLTQYHDVTRSHIIKELALKIEDSEYQTKEFLHNVDNGNADRVILDNRAVEEEAHK